MPSARVVKRASVAMTPRTLQVEGMFDIAPGAGERIWEADLPIEQRAWNVGLITGPSGSGKTSIAQALFGEQLIDGYEWPSDRALVDAFDKRLSIGEVTSQLLSVGLASPRSWLQPFHTLSGGEQFRATLARAMSESRGRIVIDEYANLLDSVTARVASLAVSRAVRTQGRQLVAVTSRDDVLAWLDPDWVYRADENTFSWREVRRRPEIELRVRRCDRKLWRRFRRHHYLSAALHPTSSCYVACVEERPAVFAAVLPFPHPKRPGWREHRLVCLPDYQGVGIASAVSECIAASYGATGRPFRSVTGSPRLIRHRARSPLWRMTRRPGRLNRRHQLGGFDERSSRCRITASFEYLGPARPDWASRLGIINEKGNERLRVG